MAGFTVSVSSWIPEDDILLKNAVEAGASLEALAKGAVRFSRKFSIRELQDRWYSLLYDPVISAQASACMAEFELPASSKFIRSGIGMHNGENPPKRKVDSVRRLYHTLRKKTCIRPSDSPSVNLLGSPNRNDGSGDGTACQEYHDTSLVNSMLGDCIHNHFEIPEMDIDLLHHRSQNNNLFEDSVQHDIFEHKNVPEDPARILEETLVDFGNCPGVEGMRPSTALPESDTSFHTLGYSSPRPRTPLWKTIEDIPAPAMPINLIHGVEDKSKGSEETFILPDVMDEKKINFPAISESDFADLSDSLLNLENEDGLNPADANGRETTNKSSCGGNNQMLLSANNPCEDHVPDVKEDHVPDVKEPETCLAIPDDSCTAELKVIVDHSLFHNGNQHDTCPEVNAPSSALTRHYQIHDLTDREMECVLNSEDPEIPCNNDFMSGKDVAPSALQARYKGASDLVSSFSTHKNTEQKLSLMRKGDNPAQCFTASRMEGSDLFPGSSDNHPLFSSGIKSKSLDFNYLAGVSGQANNALEELGQCRAPLPSQKSGAGLGQELFYACNVTTLPLNAKSNSTANPSTSDQEASIDQEESENDDDIPYFSDIESLILDMDLCPDDQDSYFSREVLNYRLEGTKRTIVRLEQCARSAMQRAITYQGVLAIFYGRRLKYFIKRTEIILGRATVDIDVDIDLAREGHANKISRRQALIKMEHDGSFFLKNLGKSSIFLNGKEIAKGQAASLCSSSLVEIREMAFMFEINHKSVRDYLANVTDSKQEKNTNFKWSEGFHGLRKP